MLKYKNMAQIQRLRPKTQVPTSTCTCISKHVPKTAKPSDIQKQSGVKCNIRVHVAGLKRHTDYRGVTEKSLWSQ